MKNTYKLARKAIELYPLTDYADRKAIIHARKSWLRSVLKLGRKWVLSMDRDSMVLAVCLMTIPVQLVWGL